MEEAQKGNDFCREVIRILTPLTLLLFYCFVAKMISDIGIIPYFGTLDLKSIELMPKIVHHQ